MQLEQDGLNVYLRSTDQNINLCTREGADIFLLQQQDEGSSFQGFLSSNLETATALQRKNSNVLNNEDKHLLSGIYFMIDSLAKYSTPAVFATIPKSEIESLIDHVITVLTLKTQDARWSQTGIIEPHDAYILIACIPIFVHLEPVIVALERGFYKVLADFVRQAPCLPCQNIAETICRLCANTIILIFNNEHNSKQSLTWTVEKTFRKLESCGMLAQFIRCSTVPPWEERKDLGILKFYEELVHCQVLIKKKFKKGQPCGDLIINILNGKDGHKKDPRISRVKIMQYLTTIARLADIMQPDQQQHQKNFICFNSNCSKAGLAAECEKTCSRCQQAYYCSKTCQIADWKIHKKHCRQVSKTEKKKTDVRHHLLINFAKANSAEIMREIVEVCDKHHLTKAEILLEVDFMPDESGLAPALQVPAKFIVAKSQGYLEGSRPDWFYKHVDSSRDYYKKSAIKNVIAMLNDNYQRLTSDSLLVLMRYPGGVSVSTVRLTTTDYKGKGALMLFSDKAVVDATRKMLIVSFIVSCITILFILTIYR